MYESVDKVVSKNCKRWQFKASAFANKVLNLIVHKVVIYLSNICKPYFVELTIMCICKHLGKQLIHVIDLIYGGSSDTAVNFNGASQQAVTLGNGYLAILHNSC